MKKYLHLLCLSLFILPQISRASHAQGADLWYKFIGWDSITHNTQYLVTATFYRDCSGISAPGSMTLSVTDTQCTGGIYAMSVTLTRVTGQPCPYGGVSGANGCEVSHLCTSALSSSTCSGGSQYPGMQKYVYEGFLTIPGNTPSNYCNQWVISVEESARNASDNVTGGGSANLYIEAVINNAIDPTTGRPYANNSPTFLNDPVPFACVNNASPLTYSNGTIEQDGDSIVYELTTPLQEHNSPLTFQSGFSVTQPIISAFPCRFDPATGILTYDPTQTNVDVLAYRISEYRHGILVGSVMRDVQIKILNCTETPPVFGTPVVQGGILRDSSLVTGCMGEHLIMDIPITAGNNVTMTLESDITAYPSLFPGMSFTQQGTGTAITAHVEWTAIDTGCRYVFIKAYSDDCPVQAVSYKGIRICPDQRIAVTPSSAVYCGRPVHLTASGGAHPHWAPLAGISSGSGLQVDVYPTTSTWYVVTTDCGADTVFVRVAPAFTAAISHDTTICNGNELQLRDIVSGPGLYSYTWSPSADLYTVSGLPGAHTSFPVLRTGRSGTYTCVVTDTTGCQITDSVHVTVRGGGTLSVTGDTLVAPGGLAHLHTAVQSYLPECTVIADSGRTTQVAEVRLGLDTSIQSGYAFSYPSPFGNYYKSARHQILFKAAELQAALGSARILSSLSIQIGFYAGASTVTNFTVKMACVHADSLTGYIGAGDLQTVVNPKSYTAVANWNTLIFDHPYVWDGVSDLVVDMCFQATTSGNINSRCRYSLTSYRSIYCTYSNDPAGQCGYTGTQQTTPVTYARYFQRPNVKFGTATYLGPASALQWQPATGTNGVDSAHTPYTTAHPQSDQWYTASIADSVCPQADSVLVRITTHGIHTPQNVTLCAGDSVLLAASNASAYSWSDSTGVISIADSFYYHPLQSSDVVLVMTDNTGQVHIDTSHIIVLPETVWPGDVNNDHVANYNDMLYIGIANGHNGPARAGASIVWTPQCAQRWGYHFLFGGDYAYADCNGDGLISYADTLAISQNWGLTHLKTDDTRAALTYLTITTDTTVYHVHDTVRATVAIGGALQPAQQLYGIAYRVDFGSSSTAHIIRMDQSRSWTGQRLSMARTAAAGATFLAQTRMDHIDTTGYGAIADIWYVVDHAAAQLDAASLLVSASLVLTSTGDTIPVNGASTSFTIDDRSLGVAQPQAIQSITIAPNPNNGYFRILMSKYAATDMAISDAIGREVQRRILSDENTDVDLSALPAGVYTVHFISGAHQSSQRLVIAR